MNVPEKGSRHAALDMGCETCHTTHKTGDQRQSRVYSTSRRLLPPSASIATMSKEAQLQKAHHDQPFAHR